MHSINSYKFSNKNFLDKLINSYNAKNKDKVLNLLIDNNKLLLQLEILMKFNNNLVSNNKKLLLNSLNFLLVNKGYFLTKQEKLFKNLRGKLVLKHKSLSKESLRKFLVKNCFFIKFLVLGSNFKIFILISELYSFLLGSFYNSNNMINSGNFTKYKFERGFMGDLVFNYDTKLLKTVISKINENKVFFSKKIYILKKNMLNNNFFCMHKSKESCFGIRELNFNKFIIYFCIATKESSLILSIKNLNFYEKILDLKKFFYFSQMKFFERNFFKMDKKISSGKIYTSLRASYENEFLIKLLSFIVSKKHFFSKFLKTKLLLLLLNEKHFAIK